MSRFPEPLAFALAGAASYRSLAVLRIGVSAVLLFQAAVLWAYRDILLNADGLIAWEVSEQWLDPLLLRMSHVHALLAPLGLEANGSAAVLLATHAIAALLLLLGKWTRAAALLAWITYLPLKATGQLAMYGVGGITLIALFYCVVMPVGRAWSLDARGPRALPASPADGGAVLPVMVLRLHMCIFYAAAGLSKVVGPQWWSGEAVWRALSLPQFQQVDPEPLLGIPGVLQAAAIAAMLIQASYPVLVWTRLRVPIVLLVELLHLGIALFLGLWLFSLIMFVMNLAAFGESIWEAVQRRHPQRAQA